MTCHLEDSVSCIELFPIMTSEFLVLPSVNPEDLISGSNSGLRVVGGFHKSLEQQKTVPPKSHPFSGGEIRPAGILVVQTWVTSHQ